MKKILVALMLVLVLSLSGCGNVFEEQRIDAEKKNRQNVDELIKGGRR